MIDSVSDHLPLVKSLPLGSDNSRKESFEFRDFKPEKIIEFKIKLLNENFDHIDNIQYANQKWIPFFEIYYKLFEESFPLKKVKLKKKTIYKDPWLNANLTAQQEQERKLYKKGFVEKQI